MNFIFILFVIYNLQGQELPPINHHTSYDYQGDSQNWMISQASNKFIYVANNDGLLEYNGTEWTLYSSPNNTIIRAVKVINDTIYTGCYMEFGYWTKNQFNKLQYQSLVPELKEKMVNDEHIWSIKSYEEWILFQSQNRIYFYNRLEKKFKIISSDNVIVNVFKINNTIYYHILNEGIYKLDRGVAKLITDENVFKKDRVINLFAIDNGLLVQTRKNGFYTLIDTQVHPWSTPDLIAKRNVNIFNSIKLKDNSFILGTISKGVIHLSQQGKIIYQIDQNNGLSNNTALSLFEDEDKNVWIGLDNGIDCINIKSPVRVFNDDKGLLGTVYSSAVLNGLLYLGTNQGLFYKNTNVDEPFKLISGTSGQVWNLFVYNNELFCGHHLGTYIIDGDQATLTVNQPGTWGFKLIPGKDNMLLQGNYDGLNIITKENGVWRLKNKIDGFDFSARYFELFPNNDIFISHGYKGIFKLKVSSDFTEVLDFHLDSTRIGKNSSITKYNDQLLYAYEKGVFKYDFSKNIFVKDTLLSSIVTKGSYLTGKLVADDTGKLWAFSTDNISYVTVNDLNNEFKVDRISIPVELRKGKIGYENIYYLGDSKYLLGTSNGYITLDLTQINEHKKYKIELNSIALKTHESADFTNINLSIPGEFKQSENSISFSYSVAEFEKYKTVEYQYKLNGFNQQWSKWDKSTNITFNNLKFGDYHFEVRAKVGNTISGNIKSYDFTILRPWYFSNLAIIGYFLALFGIILITHRTYKKYYRKQLVHKQLENEQMIIKINNEKLNLEIENKNRELALSTMSIIRKNEALVSIRKELKSIDKGPKPSTKAVLNLIDKNLKDTKDWRLFKDAFNSVDKDFLKKIEALHPILTPNDLRFCAFLKLNLSSKEIAPLLNISVKSVETRRYRLRKKINLPHETSLVKYLFEI